MSLRAGAPQGGHLPRAFYTPRFSHAVSTCRTLKWGPRRGTGAPAYPGLCEVDLSSWSGSWRRSLQTGEVGSVSRPVLSLEDALWPRTRTAGRGWSVPLWGTGRTWLVPTGGGPMLRCLRDQEAWPPAPLATPCPEGRPGSEQRAAYSRSEARTSNTFAGTAQIRWRGRNSAAAVATGAWRPRSVTQTVLLLRAAPRVGQPRAGTCHVPPPSSGMKPCEV